MKAETPYVHFAPTPVRTPQTPPRGQEDDGSLIPRAPRGDSLPLSFSQQRLWFIDQFGQQGPAYKVSVARRLTGSLDIEALRRALDAIVARHEVLRTSFPAVDGVPRQVILDCCPMPFDFRDLSILPGSAREPEMLRGIKEEANKRFDLACGPLIRGFCWRIAEDEHVLLLTMHHIVSDGWSLTVLFRELSEFYRSSCKGEPANLPDLPIQYADYAEWQRQWLQGDVLKQQLSYWKRHLEDAPATLGISADRSRPPIQTFRGAQQTLIYPRLLLDKVKELSRQQSATPFMTLLAAFKCLLYRYSGQEDVIVGTPIANRTHEQIENLIGFFANTLALRTDLSGSPSFRELLHRVREVALGAYSHQDLPFERVVEELQPERDLSRSPFFQVMFTFQSAGRDDLKMPGLTVQRVEVPSEEAKFDLIFSLVEEHGGLKVRAFYSTDLFDSDTVFRMIGHYERLLDGIVANPDQRLSELPLLTSAERHQLLVEWNDTKADYPRNACIHHLFEAQVERTPEATAVVFEGRKLTYRELNARANQLAHYLKKRAVGPDVLVGICVERSLEMVVGLLGILKAGGAYVPLDPKYPIERLAFMARDTAIPLLLTQNRLAAGLSSAIPELLCLDTDAERLTVESEQNLPAGARAENLAYVMYTSGSTGTPKGVEIPHRGIVRLVMNKSYARFHADETFLQLAPLSFDASTFELWAALLHGATCVLYPAGVPSPERLGEVIRQHRVSTLWLTASLFNVVIDEAPAALRGVSQLLIGGEQLSTPHVRSAQRQLPNTRIINGYGPTENTTFTCCYAIPQGLAPDTTLPIGRPIANTRVYILDPQQSPVPIGIHGRTLYRWRWLGAGLFETPRADGGEVHSRSLQQ